MAIISIELVFTWNMFEHQISQISPEKFMNNKCRTVQLNKKSRMRKHLYIILIKLLLLYKYYIINKYYYIELN
jgi:hypothetical protein